jgi:hypothetical protein
MQAGSLLMYSSEQQLKKIPEMSIPFLWFVEALCFSLVSQYSSAIQEHPPPQFVFQLPGG